MTALQPESLYSLLPAIYRARDLANGEPLRALLGIIEEELTRIESDITGLYDNLFIETCDDWVIPYIGDLVGLKLLVAGSQRAFTANTLGYRRRKGTLLTLATLARDATSWPARSVEYMPLVNMTQQMNSFRSSAILVPDLHELDVLDNVNTPFDTVARTVDLRATGRYHRDQVGLFVWRRGAFALPRVRAVAASGQTGGFYMNPLGCNVPLHNSGISAGWSSQTQLQNAPQPLKRTVLFRALESRRQALCAGLTPQDPYFGAQPVLCVFTASASGTVQQVPSEQILIAELDNWWIPPSELPYTQTTNGQTTTKNMPIQVAVDPELGRLTFPPGQVPSQVWTTYSYGFAGALGGGGYDRSLADPATGARVVTVTSGDAGGVLQNLSDPTLPGSQWTGAGANLCVVIADSDTYSIGPLHVPAGARLELRAADWQRPLLLPVVNPSDSRWHVTLGAGATLVLNGLLIAGAVTLDGEQAGGAATSNTTVSIFHSTLVPSVSLLPSGGPAAPGTVSLKIGTGLAGLTLLLNKSISGAIDLSAAATGVSGQSANLSASDSIIDASGGSQPAILGTQATLLRVTVLGGTQLQSLVQTVDTLFCGPAVAPAGPNGGVNYCYLPAGSNVPLPNNCISASASNVQLVPWFISTCYGNPGYGQLDTRCTPAIRNGASVQGEIGAMQFLQQAQREANVLERQAEYLRFGLTLNLFPVT